MFLDGSFGPLSLVMACTFFFFYSNENSSRRKTISNIKARNALSRPTKRLSRWPAMEGQAPRHSPHERKSLVIDRRKYRRITGVPEFTSLASGDSLYPPEAAHFTTAAGVSSADERTVILNHSSVPHLLFIYLFIYTFDTVRKKIITAWCIDAR